MMATKIIGMLLAVVSLLEFGFSWAAESQKTLQLLVKILPRASLSLDRTQITFVGYEDQKIIPSQGGPMTVMTKGRASLVNLLTLTISANSDLEGSQGRIPIQQVQWTYQGQNSKSQALSRGDQMVGFWNKSGVNRGELQFVLKNNGSLAPGDYAGSIILTLSSP
jgi:hypothetical protein